MPEGPEIKRVADKVGRVLVGAKLQEVQTHWPALEGYADSWKGLEVASVSARGKALLTRLENGDILYSHNQLYGRWVTRRDGKQPASTRTLRLALRTEKGAAHLFSATDIEVLQEPELSRHYYLSKLGPDILDPDLKPGEISRRLNSKEFRNRQLAGLLLDQGFLAGPGNYLRSEILFISGVHPRRKPRDLDPALRLKLARTILKISQRAYEKAGVTTEDKLAKKLKAQGQRRRQYRHYVFGRKGQPCRLCETEIVKDLISSRSVFFCPNCQSE